MENSEIAASGAAVLRDRVVTGASEALISAFVAVENGRAEVRRAQEDLVRLQSKLADLEMQAVMLKIEIEGAKSADGKAEVARAMGIMSEAWIPPPMRRSPTSP